MLSMNNIAIKIWRFILKSIWKIVVISYLLSVFSSFLSGWVGAILSPFNTIFPVILTSLLIVLIGSIRYRNKRHIIFIVLLLVLTSPFIWKYCPLNLNKEIEKNKDTDLSIISYNVNIFKMDNRWSACPSGIIDYLKQKNADIVCLQEATLQPYSSYGLTIEEIKGMAGKQYPYIECDMAKETYGSRLMILSKFPIIKKENLNLNSSFNGAMAYLLNVRGDTTLVINAHLESFKLRMPFKSREESIKHIKDTIEKTKSAISSKKGITRSYYLRHKQADDIVDFIKNKNIKKVIVCGDCNDTPNSYTVSKIAKDLTNCFTASGQGLGISFRSNIFIVRIDNIFVSDCFKPMYCKVLNDVYLSDHYPIYTIIRDKEKTQP